MTDQLETVRRTVAGARDVAEPARAVETARAAQHTGAAEGASGGMHVSYTPRRSGAEESRRRFYVSVRTKFVGAGAIALCWLGLSVWLAVPWIRRQVWSWTLLQWMRQYEQECWIASITLS